MVYLLVYSVGDDTYGEIHSSTNSLIDSLLECKCSDSEYRAVFEVYSNIEQLQSGNVKVIINNVTGDIDEIQYIGSNQNKVIPVKELVDNNDMGIWVKSSYCM